MRKRITTKSYFFSVEGETERWYLDHLQRIINNSKRSIPVKFIIRVKKDPREMVKSYPFDDKTTINHICDIESNSDEHKKIFRQTLDNMESVRLTSEELIGKELNYRLGYSNYTFDLWVALHKRDCNAPLSDRKQYLKYLNSGFEEHFSSMDEYKEEDNFKRCMKKITLDNVITAIERAEKIMANNKSNGYKSVEYKKFTYYTENPSLSVHEIIADILRQCELIP